jgi:hypothetical protein
VQIYVPRIYDESSEWIAMLSTVAAFFDESGKFKDHRVISIGCVGGYVERTDGDFARQWAMLLGRYGLKVISAKDVFNYKRPLSKKNPCLGIEDRTKALGEFISCIRNNLQVIVGMATDAEAFKKLPPHFFQYFGTTPSFMTFVRTVMHVSEFTPDGSKVTMICDDDEEIAIPFFKLYRRVKKVWPDARRKFGGIAFVDDRYLFGVQASDLVAALVRLEATEQITGEKYDYKSLYEATFAPASKHERYLFNVAIAVADQEKMLATAEGLRESYEQAQAEAKTELEQ